jgi:hypothetical protein
VADNRDVGLYGKFYVRRADGKDTKGQKHYRCDYFVLDATHDPHSRAALRAYADSCEDEFPLLAIDLRRLARLVPEVDRG